MSDVRYCLDANVLIQPWQKYYNPRLCPDYWEMMSELGRRSIVFIPELVYEEIANTDDDLAEWLRASSIEKEAISEGVTRRLQEVYAHDRSHRTLVDNVKGRSLADPWLVAHALHNGAVVVTKEDLVTAANAKRIKIPNVCENMNIPWMNDFEMVEALGVRFTCSRIQP